MTDGRRHNAEIVLEGLLLGLILDHDDYRYVIRDGQFGILAYKLEGFDEPGDVFLGLDWSLSLFISWCETIPESEIYMLGANTTLHKMRKPR